MEDGVVAGVSVTVVILIIAIYLIPTVIAVARKHRSVMAIAAVNILIGWTLIGYFWAFIWSLSGNVRER